MLDRTMITCFQLNVDAVATTEYDQYLYVPWCVHPWHGALAHSLRGRGLRFMTRTRSTIIQPEIC